MNPAPRPNRSRLVAIVAVLVAVGIAIAGILSRRHQESEVAKWTAEHAVPIVATVTPKQGVTGQQVVAARRYRGLVRGADLCAGERLSQGLVFRFRRACREGPAAGGNRCARSRRPVGRGQGEAGVGRSPGQGQGGGAQFCRDDLCALARLAEGRRFRAGDRNQRRRNTAAPIARYKASFADANVNQSQVDQLTAFEDFKRIVAPFDGIVTAAQYRCRRADQRRQRRQQRAAAVSRCRRA